MSGQRLGYDPTGFYDEAFEAPGRPRPQYRSVVDELERLDLAATAERVRGECAERGVRYGSSDPFPVDPVPRIITRDEWSTLERGLTQRVRALNAFLADAYGERRIVADGRIPARVIDGAELLEPDMVGLELPGGVHCVLAGLDLLRDADGTLRVLEDNLRTPTAFAYAAAAREVLFEHVPIARPEIEPFPGVTFDVLGDALRAAAPNGGGDPSIVVLADGPENSAWFEQVEVARQLGVPVVTLADLELRAGTLYAATAEGRREVQVVYRRTDEDRLVDEHGRRTAVGEALFEPLRLGRLGCVNAFGTGLGDDKLVHVYAEELVRYYLGEEPLVHSVPSYDLGQPGALDDALDRIGELVLKRRAESGGTGVVMGATLDEHGRRELAEEVRRAPEGWIAQEPVQTSRHPTVIDGRLAPRHVDLRPFVVSTATESKVLPGGLTRVALEEGGMIVNMAQGGGGKDTWILR